MYDMGWHALCPSCNLEFLLTFVRGVVYDLPKYKKVWGVLALL